MNGSIFLPLFLSIAVNFGCQKQLASGENDSGLAQITVGAPKTDQISYNNQIVQVYSAGITQEYSSPQDLQQAAFRPGATITVALSLYSGSRLVAGSQEGSTRCAPKSMVLRSGVNSVQLPLCLADESGRINSDLASVILTDGLSADLAVTPCIVDLENCDGLSSGSTSGSNQLDSIIGSGGDTESKIDNTLSKQIDDFSGIFAESNYLRIGDDSFSSASACAAELRSSYPGLDGSEYYFEFNVVEPNTTIKITLNFLCGTDSAMDYEYTTESRIDILSPTGQDSRLIASFGKADRPESRSAQFDAQTAGVYLIRVAGGRNKNGGDIDDFVIKGLSISADAPIRLGRIGAKKPN